MVGVALVVVASRAGQIHCRHRCRRGYCRFPWNCALMLYAFFIALALVWALAYATGYAKGQQMLLLKARILRTLAEERAKNPQRWN